jgi:23S rRNA 5-hydroxycytidine C2501 synthase
MPSVELLAPARDATTGIAAIHCGADAVYIGASKFGARKAAGNEMVEIARLARHAHLYRAKVYLALNTVLKNEELDEAVKLIYLAWNAGIDGLILQDMGLLECDLPPVPLIASTQTDNRTVEQVSFLEKTGFSRVILARELSMEEILQIRKSTAIELEFFVHGALCVSYSGQCYFSQSITGRSANRGECAQPCRSAYNLVDAEGKVLLRNRHLLSLKDLNLSAYLRELIDAGISSFKIEGRLKDLVYVKNITAFYRQRLDAILSSDQSLSRPSSGKSIVGFEPDPDRSFNRGYTTHFTSGRQEGMSSFLSQKSIGKKIGTVIRAEGEYIWINTIDPLKSGDGICYFDREKELRGFLVNHFEKGRVWPNEMKPIDPGTEIYRNLDHGFNKAVETASCKRKINVELIFKETEKGFVLQARDEDRYMAEKEIFPEKEAASNKERMLQAIREQLAKSGDTIFSVGNIQIDWMQPCFLPISAVNGLRREVLSELEITRTEQYDRKERKDKPAMAGYFRDTVSYHGNVLNEKAADFYRKRGATQIQPAMESEPAVFDGLLMTTRYCLKYELGACPSKQAGKKEGKSAGPLFLQDANRRYKLEFDCNNCEMKVMLEKPVKQ